LKHIDDVVANLTYVFDGLKDGSIKPNTACEMNNACGKVLSAAKMQLEYFKLMKEPPRIKLLEPQTTALESA
jgi:hypothetical protein